MCHPTARAGGGLEICDESPWCDETAIGCVLAYRLAAFAAGKIVVSNTPGGPSLGWTIARMTPTKAFLVGKG
jgi:hypothetical protein